MTIQTDGTIALPHSFEKDRLEGIKVRSDRMDNQFQEVVDGINAQLDRSGIKPMLNNLNMNNYKITSLKDGVNKSDAVTVNQLDMVKNNYATTYRPGQIALAKLNDALLAVDPKKAMTPSTTKKLIDNILQSADLKLPQNHFYGFILTRENNKSLGITPGIARDSTNQINIASFVKISKSTQKIFDLNSGVLVENIIPEPDKVYYVFVVASKETPKKQATFITPDVSANLINLLKVKNGFLTILTDSKKYDLNNLNFSTCQNLSDITDILNNQLDFVNVDVKDGKIVFTSLLPNDDDLNLTVSSTPGEIGDDLTVEKSFNIKAGLKTKGEESKKQIVNVIIDDNINGSNISSAEAIIKNNLNFRRLIGTISFNDQRNIKDIKTTENLVTVDLKNADPNPDFIKKSVSWGMPDYSAPLWILSKLLTEKGFIAPCDGILVGGINVHGNLHSGITVNGVRVLSANGGVLPVNIVLSKGDKVQSQYVHYNDQYWQMYFIPFKGAV